MEKEILINYIEDNSKLNDTSIKDLEAVISKYPYFQSACSLLLQNLKISKNPEYINWLRKLIVNIPNRTKFFNLINEIEAKDKEINKEKTEIKKEEPETITEKDTVNKHKEKEVPFLNKEDTDIDLLVLDENDNRKEIRRKTEVITQDRNIEEEKSSTYTTEKTGKNDLIDEFIIKQPRIKPPSDGMKEKDEIKDISETSIKESDDYISETLAKIYIKQGYYSKAIFI
ncbi:MAG: hypothetical protein JXB17_08950, partial [Bacteroidales bacterium]|nr:hypothetical protein [Bacteroidales bacterium]